ncbi:MAG: hypothetical protein J5518_00255 [Lachnospiraceae bacterium]|nr:hypothetical protein [Lachnospiraceae bacterium]
MKKIVIIGNAEHALTMCNYITITGPGEVVGFAVNESIIKEKTFCNRPVVPVEHLTDYYDPEDVSLIMGVGYTSMGQVKHSLMDTCMDMGYHFENYIHPTAIISDDVIIGTANNILDGVILESGVVIGDCNLLFGGCMIAHDTTIGSYNTFSVKAVVAGCTKVGSHCFVGANATVRDHVEIHDFALIGAAAYADGDVDSYAVLAAQKSVLISGKRSVDML